MAKKPRIFINIHYMEIGGAERALLGLLDALDSQRVDVDLFINQHTGPFMKLIPEWVNLLPEIKAYSVCEKPVTTAIKSGRIDIALARMWAKVPHWFYARRRPADHANDTSIFHYAAQAVRPFLPTLKRLGRYDLALSFVIPHQVVLNKVDAACKLAWVHTDYTVSTVNEKAELPVWNGFDRVVTISPEVTKTFTTAFPQLKPKIIEIENILSPAMIRRQAQDGEAVEMTNDGYKILTIGRPCYAKNFEIIPEVAQELKQQGLRFCWYVVGGFTPNDVAQKIKEYGLDENIRFLGPKPNPYPYMAACDLYVQPSRYEGKCIAIREAQVLARPVLITPYPTAPSQLRNGIDGIVSTYKGADLARDAERMLTDEALRRSLISAMEATEYGNTSEVNKLYQLING